MNHINKYPNFVANQVLKSSILNDSFSYVDEQIRLSRIKLFGQGILDGLDFSIEGGILTIGSGTAVNSNGWMVEVPQATSYKYIAAPLAQSGNDFVSDSLDDLASLGGSRVEYICFKEKDDALQLGLKPMLLSKIKTDAYVVALACGKRKELNSRCSHGSCDINVSSTLVEVWPVLVRIDDSKQKPVFKKLFLCDKRLYSFSAVLNLTNNGSLKAFNSSIGTAFRIRVREASNGVFIIMANFLFQPVNLSSFKPVFCAWDNYFKSGHDLINRLYNVYSKLNRLDKETQNAEIVPDYAFMFAGDIIRALNECFSAFNDFAGKYQRLPNMIPSGSLIYLGKALKAEAEGEYRHYFIESGDSELKRDAATLERLLKRVCLLSERFIGKVPNAELDKYTAQVLYSRPGASISERPIPFYYGEPDKEFLECWNADKNSSYRAIADFNCKDTPYYKTSVSPLLEGLDVYLDGYQNKPFRTVTRLLSSSINTWRLNWGYSEVRLNSVKRLTPAHYDYLVANYATTKFFDYSERAMYSTSDEIRPVTKLIRDFWSYGGSADKVKENLKKLRDGVYLTGSFVQTIPNIDLVKIRTCFKDYTRTLESGLDLPVSNKNNNFADPLFSALYDLLSCLLDNACHIKLGSSYIGGPIRSGCTIYLLTKKNSTNPKAENQVVSYSVVYNSV